MSRLSRYFSAASTLIGARARARGKRKLETPENSGNGDKRFVCFVRPQARLAELDTPRRLENLQKLEELKRHLMDLEKQVRRICRAMREKKRTCVKRGQRNDALTVPFSRAVREEQASREPRGQHGETGLPVQP